MAYRLVAQIGSRQIREPLGAGSYTLGSGSQADIILREPTVSRLHAKLEVRDEALTLTDLGSRNGTHIGNRRIDTAILAPHEPFRLGELHVHVEAARPGDLQAAVPPAPPLPQAVAPASVATMTTEFKQRFLSRLPGLLNQLTKPDASEHFSIALSRAIGDSEPTVDIEIAQDDAVLARVPKLDQTFTERGEKDRYSITIRHSDQSASANIRTIIDIGLDLLRLSSDNSIARTAAPENKPSTKAKKPEPATLFEPLRDIYDQSERVAQAAINVLITGETGTGKELLAGFLHQASGLPRDKFVALNCAALPSDLLEAELFGIEAKVATGVRERAGKFELAHGGTLFLDEIGDMSLETQAKLLRVLQEQQVYRVGGHQPYPAVVRVISATNQPIEEQIEARAFRRDLFHRIADWTVQLPTLAERVIDVPNLASYFLRQECNKTGVRFGGISRAAMNCLQRYPWPGNVRELEREMIRASVFLNDGEMLDSDRLQPRFREGNDVAQRGSLQLVIEASERRAIRSALEQFDGNVDLAAQFLDVGKSTLYRRMKHLDLG